LHTAAVRLYGIMAVYSITVSAIPLLVVVVLSVVPCA
jgi:hypothetical protein